ncbi:hypothetical protein ACLIR7_03685 [Nitratireductor aquimarinus]
MARSLDLVQSVHDHLNVVRAVVAQSLDHIERHNHEARAVA